MAATEIGFFTIVNCQSVDMNLRKEVFLKSKQFFNLPQTIKDEFKMDGNIVSGYFGKGMENLENVKDHQGEKATKQDCKEGFDMGYSQDNQENSQ